MRWSSSCASSSGSAGRWSGWGAPFAIVLGLAASAAAQPRPFALDDVAAFKTIGEAAVSPDGRSVVFTVRTTVLDENRTQTDLWQVPVDGTRAARPLTYDRPAESALRWSPDGMRLAFLSDRDGSRQVWSLPAAGGEAVRLTAHPESIAAFAWSPDGARLAILAPPAKTEDEKTRERNGDDAYLLGAEWRNNRVWVAAVNDRDPERLRQTSRQVTDGRFHVRSVAWSPDGARLAVVVAPNAEADASEDAKAQVIDVATGAAQDVPGGGLAGNLAWSPDGRHLAFTRAFDGRGISREDLHVWEVGSSDAARNLSSALDRDVEDLFWTLDGRGLDVRVSHGATHSLVRVGLEGGPLEPRRFSFPIGVLARGGASQVFVRADRPAELFTGADEPRAKALTALNAAASGVQLPAIEAVRWRGPAGEVEGILLRPHDHDAARRYPLLVNPHGGPRAHSTLAFDPIAAYWTSLGYVVLKPNFRGSTGYGDAFTKANVGDWGDGPYRDVLAGVDALVTRGIADPDRLFMYGWSYGGILANWTATHTDRFKAIVSGASVADGRLQYAISDSRRWRFDYFGGSPFLDAHAPLYQRESPVTHAKHAKSPTLFVVGAEDKRCPPEQSLMMYRAFRDHGVTTDLLIYPREDHGFVEPRHILDRAKRVAEWFRRFDPAAAKTTSSEP